MKPKDRGAAAFQDGKSIEDNPYRPYYMRCHWWSGWRSQCNNPAWWQWCQGYWGAAKERCAEVIRGVLTERGKLTEVDLGLAVMSEFGPNLTSTIMKDAVCQMKINHELSEGIGLYQLLS